MSRVRVKLKAPRTRRGFPTAPPATSSRTLRVWGWWRYMKASATTTPASRATAATWSTSSRVMASGFSHSTCLPARAARTVHSAWKAFGTGT